jgi:hypothetical protein
MAASDKAHDSADESNPIEIVTSWGLVLLAIIAAAGALLRILSPQTIDVARGLDQTTLLYLGVAGALLLLKQIKTFSLGQLKLEMIEKIRERQDRQEERLADMALILPLLLPSEEVKHIKNVFARTTGGYHGSHAVRTELRRLASIGLLTRRAGKTIAEMKDGTEFDLAEVVELTDLGRRWALRIQEMEA